MLLIVHQTPGHDLAEVHPAPGLDRLGLRVVGVRVHELEAIVPALLVSGDQFH